MIAIPKRHMTESAPLRVPHVPAPPDVGEPPKDSLRSEDAANPRRFFFSKPLRPGNGGAHPGPADVVTVHYTAWTTGGSTIDDSQSRGQPAVWHLNDLMDGLARGIRLMVPGEKRRFWIPPAMAHEWATEMLVYDVDLITCAPPPGRPVRAEIGNPPQDAVRTSSGLAFKVLRAGAGTEHPKPLGTVTVHYTAWTSNGGEIFDDSVGRNAPATTPVDTLIPGLSEAIQRMVVGEKTRFWIPPELAYSEPMPRAAFVFDVELLAIQHAAEGRPGTIRVQCNSPDAIYTLILPDGTPQRAKGAQTFADLAPGSYRIQPARLKLYSIGIVASPADLTLAPGGMLEITINYFPIVE